MKELILKHRDTVDISLRPEFREQAVHTERAKKINIFILCDFMVIDREE